MYVQPCISRIENRVNSTDHAHIQAFPRHSSQHPSPPDEPDRKGKIGGSQFMWTFFGLLDSQIQGCPKPTDPASINISLPCIKLINCSNLMRVGRCFKHQQGAEIRETVVNVGET